MILKMLIKFLLFCNKIFHSGPSTPHPQHKQNLAKLRTHTLSKGPLLPWTHTLARHKLISLSVFWSRGLHVNFERRASSSVPDFKGISQSTMSIRKTVRGCRPSTSSGPPEPHKASTSTAAGVAPSADVLAVLLGGYLGERISGPFSPGRCWWCWRGYDEDQRRGRPGVFGRKEKEFVNSKRPAGCRFVLECLFDVRSLQSTMIARYLN